MPVKWTDGIERMMLIQFLRQNVTAKFVAEEAIENWPADLDKPTVRSIKDRFGQLRKHTREGTVASSVAASTGLVAAVSSPQTRTPQSVPKTPRAKKDNAPATKKIKTDTSVEAKEEDLLSTANSTSVTPFKSRLLESLSTPRSASMTKGRRQATKGSKKNSGNKRKRVSPDSEEESMTSHNSSSPNNENSKSDSESEEEDVSPNKDASPTRTISSRRSLPLRRSKSKTPVTYAVYNIDSDNECTSGNNGGKNDREEGDGGNISHTEHENKPFTYHSSKNKGKGTRRQQIMIESASDSDSEFNPNADRMRERHDSENGRGKKRKAAWEKRVAMMDSRGEEWED